MDTTPQPVEIVFNFDSTASMYPVLAHVRKSIVKVVGALLNEMPNMRIGIGANGDYGDLVRNGYDTTSIDLTNDIYALTTFVQNVGPTAGFGNGGECYELVLHRARSNFNWTPGATKILVMIGDEIAHTPNWHENKDRLDWRKETQALVDMGVSVYSVQCLSRPEAFTYYGELAEIGQGYYLQMDQFTDIMELLTAIIYRQEDNDKLETFENKVVTSGANRTLRTSVSALRGTARDSRGRFMSAPKKDDGTKLVPVPAGRFQIMNVPTDSVIKDFVEGNQLPFTPGRGFYEFKKRETIQDKKEIVIVEKASGDMYTGAAARQILGIPLGMGKSKISPKHGDKYDVFVQSTSYNRKLIGGDKFLYEVNLN